MTMKKEPEPGRHISHALEHMPPLNVTTTGIPAAEHLAPRVQPPDERRARLAAWVIAIASILVLVASVTVLVVSGLGPASAAGFQLRPSGERGYVAVWHLNQGG